MTTPRWLNIYVLAVAPAILIIAVSGIARAGGADVLTPAERELNAQQITPTVPPPSIRGLVNALPYQHYNDVPAMKAFRLVAAERGWSSQRIESWAPFVRDVMLGESAFCWNRRRGDIVASYSMCVITRQGRYEDVGFGQVTRSWYGSNATLCTKYGVCSSSQILASPYDSMLWSIIVPLEEAGSQSWCYNAFARSYHNCGLAPDR